MDELRKYLETVGLKKDATVDEIVEFLKANAEEHAEELKKHAEAIAELKVKAEAEKKPKAESEPVDVNKVVAERLAADRKRILGTWPR